MAPENPRMLMQFWLRWELKPSSMRTSLPGGFQAATPTRSHLKQAASCSSACVSWGMRKQTLPLNPHWQVERLRGAVRRVKLRVAMGGHHVPTDVVKQRFLRSLNNFFTLYAPLADEWTLFDNSLPPQARQIAAHSADQLIVTENTTWHKLQKLSQVA